MTGGVDDEQSGELVLLQIGLQHRGSTGSDIGSWWAAQLTGGTHLAEDGRLAPDRLHRKVRRSDLLGDTSRFALLDVRLPNLQPGSARLAPLVAPPVRVQMHLVEQLCLARVDVSENDTDWTAHVVLAPRLERLGVLCEATLLCGGLALLELLLRRGERLVLRVAVRIVVRVAVRVVRDRKSVV